MLFIATSNYFRYYCIVIITQTASDMDRTKSLVYILTILLSVCLFSCKEDSLSPDNHQDKKVEYIHRYTITTTFPVDLSFEAKSDEPIIVDGESNAIGWAVRNVKVEKTKTYAVKVVGKRLVSGFSIQPLQHAKEVTVTFKFEELADGKKLREETSVIKSSGDLFLQTVKYETPNSNK